jgi:hypothetical protein
MITSVTKDEENKRYIFKFATDIPISIIRLSAYWWTKVSGKNAFSKTCPKPTSASTSTVTGVLPCFANVSGGALVDAPTQLSLTTGKEFTITVPSEVAAKKHFMFDFPADRTVSSFKVKDLQGNFVAFEAAYSQSTEVEKTINGFTMKYKRLTTTGDYVGDGVYKITLSTNLNSADITKVLKNNN